uniref:glutathione gamma-glutamylcysteinyltransferase-like n=1 Tax=Styela clava TaxID=7725 RepID=UPI00193A242F|nr:glutathione gamma-glutamylcysteinyltransferase-like [Styela clava]
MIAATAKKTFYRRVLPDICTAFASERGKQLFKTALATEHMNCYFPLASQFRTQEEPAYCGLSSLVMVLNSLAVDPGVVWKGVFRWYHEDMLDCCSPLEEIRKIGVPMDNLMCLALCNQLDGELKRVSDTMNISEFREDVKNATKSTKIAIIVSYGRGVLGQTGTGHFSPIGGYNSQEDMVLVMDVARFKYPPYWVPLTKLWEAMLTRDVETGLYRGYMVLWRADEGDISSQPLLIFKIAQGLNAFKPILRGSGSFFLKIKSFLMERVKEQNDKDILRMIITTLLDQSYKHTESNDARDSPNLLSVRATDDEIKNSFPNHAKAIVFLLSFPTDDVTRCEGCSKNSTKNTNVVEGTYHAFLKKMINSQLEDGGCGLCGNVTKEQEEGHVLLVNEITQLRRQFAALINLELQSNKSSHGS